MSSEPDPFAAAPARRGRRVLVLAGRALLVLAGVALWGWGASVIVSDGLSVASAAAVVAGVVVALIGLAGPRSAVGTLMDAFGYLP